MPEKDEENNSKKQYAEIVKGNVQKLYNRRSITKRKEEDKDVTSKDKVC